MENTNFDYFYTNENEQYIFLQLPMMLIKDERFKGLSDSAKILYSLLLNRTSLSKKNNWTDENGRIYIIYTLEELMIDLNCYQGKLNKSMTELKECGLIKTVRQGLSKPNLIYVMNFATALKYEYKEKKEPEKSYRIKTCDFSKSGNANIANQDLLESYTSNTNLNNIDSIYMDDINIIHSFEPETKQTTGTIERTNEKYDISKIRKQVADNISLEKLINENPRKQKEITELYELIVETMYSRKKTFRIAREELDANIVKEVFAKLDYTLLEYVLQCLKKTTTGVTNTKSYLLTTLYNARNTIDNQFSFEVQHDLSIVK